MSLSQLGLRKNSRITNIVVLGLLHLEVVIQGWLLIRLCMLELDMNFSYSFFILGFHLKLHLV